MAIHRSIFGTLERLRRKRKENAEEGYIRKLSKLSHKEAIAILDKDIEKITQEILKLEAERGVTDADREKDPHWQEIRQLEKEIKALKAEKIEEKENA